MVLYDVSLDSEIELTNETLNKVKLLAYLVYDALVEYEYDKGINILYRDNIIINEIYERCNRYEFEHTDYNKGIYEPFMINDTSFGFTVYGDSISNAEIKHIVMEVQKNICFYAQLNVNYIVLKNNRDRLGTISSFYPTTRSKKLKFVNLFASKPQFTN